MKSRILSLVCLSALLFSCSKDDDDNNNNPNQARVKFVHSAVVGDSLQARSNGTAVASVPRLAYTNSSGYVNVNTGSAAYGFYSTLTGLLYKDTTVSFAANNSYTVYAAGTLNNSGIMVTADDLTPPASGNAKIRFVNLSPDNLTLKTQVGAAAADSNISYKMATSFREVAAGSYNISVGDANNFATIVNLNAQQLASGKIYTYIYNGIATGTGITAYSLVQVMNN